MADENATDRAAKPKKRKRGRIPIWIAVIVVAELVAAMAIVQIAVPGSGGDGEEDWEADAQEVVRQVDDLTVNLMDDGAKRFLRCRISIRVLAEKPGPATTALQEPGVLETRIGALLSRKRLADIQGRQEQIQEEIRELVEDEILAPEWVEKNGRARVVRILMPMYVIQ